MIVKSQPPLSDLRQSALSSFLPAAVQAALLSLNRTVALDNLAPRLSSLHRPGSILGSDLCKLLKFQLMPQFPLWVVLRLE